jgi:hypothetical protein
MGDHNDKSSALSAVIVLSRNVTAIFVYPSHEVRISRKYIILLL